MRKDELMSYLHQYTPWEKLHMQHREHGENMESFNQTLNQPISPSDKNYGLHLPIPLQTVESLLYGRHFFEERAMQNIVIVQHDRYTPPLLHKHDFFELLYVYEGEFSLSIEQDEFIMRTGDFCLISPDTYHSLHVENYSIVLNILITKSHFQEIVLTYLPEDNVFTQCFVEKTYNKNQFDYIIFNTQENLIIKNIILDMCLEMLNKEKYYHYLLNTQLLLLLGNLLRYYEQSCTISTLKKQQDTLNLKIIKYIEQHYKTLSLSLLAQHFHYSSQHMSYKLKQISGLSFSQYIQKRRMQEAAKLLSNSNMKIKDISEELGYLNQEHFIRSFRKFYQSSPSEFRMKNC